MGSVEMAALLLAGGAHKDTASSGRERPICLACRRGHRVLRTLLGAASSTSEVDSHYELQADRADVSKGMHIATKLGNASCVQLLFGASASMNCKDDDGSGKSALSHAAEAGRTDIVRLLLQAGASVDADEKRGV